ncbi:response regulator [Rhizobium deserti]|uniref:response regulator n=1 Tax=Rhizobium deserti TaxID=2547961 RepID=UPI0013868CB0|nr:response regulator [Rhizobium deserti]
MAIALICLSNKLILLLEDQPLISLDLEESFRDLGIERVLTLRSKREATSWLQSHVPDLVILDLHLSDGDCRPVLGALRKQAVPVIIYSGGDLPDGWEPELFQGCDWVQKPADPDYIVELAKAKLQKQAASA